MFGFDDILMGGLALGGLAGKLLGGFGQESAQKKAEHTRQAQQQIQVQRERTQQIRESRQKRAQITQGAVNQGAAVSSSAESGAANASQQGFANINYINNQESLGIQMSKAQQNMINAQGTSELGQGLFSLAGTLFQNRNDVKDLFS